MGCLATQHRRPDEVILVDGSDVTEAGATPAVAWGALEVRVLRTAGHLCRQRNQGVRAARGGLVLLCDDDVELPADYLDRLTHHLATHPSEGAVTGVLRDRNDAGDFGETLPAPSMRRLLTASALQLSVFGDVEGVPARRARPLVLRALKLWYRRRGNTWSLAGWPLFTQTRAPVVHVAVYSLGAALVRRDWLLASPYDESLGPHGIGDHYGVAIGFPRCPGIAVLMDLEVKHHRAPEGRLAPEDAYFQRVLALHHFMRGNTRFRWWSTAFLLWSLLGTALALTVRGEWRFVRRALAAAALILIGRNPLRTAGRQARHVAVRA